jgi:hypothetical protein
VIGICHQFVDHLISLLSLLSDYSEQFEMYRIKMEKWLMDCTINKTSNTKLSLVSSQIKDAVFSTRGAMIGDWGQVPKWNCYLADVRELKMGLYVLFMKLEKGADIHKNNHGRNEPCKYIDDTRTFECNLIGVSSRAKDPRHYQLSNA